LTNVNQKNLSNNIITIKKPICFKNLLNCKKYYFAKINIFELVKNKYNYTIYNIGHKLSCLSFTFYSKSSQIILKIKFDFKTVKKFSNNV